ncbi:MAG TPA: hypothetical protein VG454_07615 [Gemmatimonadales bacterium]|nr:hypothetical protein [Gemmatimonadales bacterium]
MFRPVLTLAAVGFVGIALFKIASGLLLPLVFLAFKIALVIAVVMGIFWWLNKKDRGKEDTPPATE